MRTLIYHITHKDNLSGIVNRGGIFAQSQMEHEPVDYMDIAHRRIQDRRSETPVPCGPGGCLHDYVPFYFAPRSPMLYAIKMGNVEDCTAGQKDIIYLVASTQKIQAAGIGFVFADGHGIMDWSEFYEDLDDLSEIDWDIMKEKYWRDTFEDPDRKRRRQAEFLVFHQFPWNIVEKIGVFDKKVEREVVETISIVSYKPTVNIEHGWYY
jgi:hypothetical protein